MIPILEPAQFPHILGYAIFLSVTLGIPVIVVSLIFLFVLEQIPSPRLQPYLPAAGAMLMLTLSLTMAGGPPTEEEYRQTWAFMMITGFFLYAFLILTPFPFIRRYLCEYSPYFAVGFTVFATFFLLACFGFIGGETRMPQDPDEYRRVSAMMAMTIAAAMFVTATLVYTGLAALGRGVNRGTVIRE